MPAIERTPPAPESYNFVVRRYDLSCINGQVYCTYDESTRSRAITIDGVEAQTLFLRTRPAFVRATKLGWKDATEEWERHLENSTARATTEPQRKLLAAMVALGDDWHTKKQIVDESQIADSEWRTAIAYLQRKQLVECNNGPRQRKTATNRSFRYRITDTGRTAVEA